MNYKYVNEKNHLMLLALLKAYGIRRVIASPGGTNVTILIYRKFNLLEKLFMTI